MFPGSFGQRCPLRYHVVALTLTTALCAVSATMVGCADSTGPYTWGSVESNITASFPDIPRITTTELATFFDDPTLEVTLLDVREAEEFAVSHLLGAVRVSSVEQAAALIAAAPEHTTIIAYCSVGYRSAALVTGLREHSTRRVYNLKGSLFRWVNENRPVYRGTDRVDEVHPFNDSWGALLDSHRHANEPSP